MIIISGGTLAMIIFFCAIISSNEAFKSFMTFVFYTLVTIAALVLTLIASKPESSFFELVIMFSLIIYISDLLRVTLLRLFQKQS